MNKIKSPRDNNKLSTTKNYLEYPVFCFKYLTTNNKYNIKYFNKFRDREKAYSALFYTIHELQKQSWEDIYNKNRKHGLETIPSNIVKFSPNGLKLTPDTKLISIRFNRDKYRLIGIKSEKNKDVLHVIGFDFNYSAYDHGK